LGAVDLSKRSTYNYKMQTLPGTELVMGFRIIGPDPDPNEYSRAKIHIGETRPINPKVHLFLQNRQEFRVIDEIGALKNEWVWSYTLGVPQKAFVYQAGKMEEVPIGEGYVHLNRIGVKADGGFGTSFTPNFWDEYSLVLEVLEGDPNSKGFQIELEAEGGGWELP
jgi:hypothetical protein